MLNMLSCVGDTICLTVGTLRKINDILLDTNNRKVTLLAAKWYPVPIRLILRDETIPSQTEYDDELLLINDLFQVAATKNMIWVLFQRLNVINMMIIDSRNAYGPTTHEMFETSINIVYTNGYVSLCNYIHKILDINDAIPIIIDCLETTPIWKRRSSMITTILNSLHNDKYTFIQTHMVKYLDGKQNRKDGTYMDEELGNWIGSFIITIYERAAERELYHNRNHDFTKRHFSSGTMFLVKHHTVESMVDSMNAMVLSRRNVFSLEERHRFSKEEQRCLDRLVLTRYLNKSCSHEDTAIQTMVLNSTLFDDDYISIDQRLSLLSLMNCVSMKSGVVEYHVPPTKKAVVEKLYQRCEKDIVNVYQRMRLRSILHRPRR